MLIPAERIKLPDSGRIRLADWLRAPLALNARGRFWIVRDSETLENNSSRRSEIVIASIPPNKWRDLWRLELSVREEHGTIALITKILKDHNIEIVAAEGGVCSFDQHSNLSFVINATDYTSVLDGDVKERYLDGSRSLSALELMLKINLLDRCLLDESDQLNLTIQRMNLYRKLHMDSGLHHRRKIIAEGGHRMNGNQFTLPKPLISLLKSNLGPDLYYSAAVDAQERFIRILFFSEADPFGHIRFFIPTAHQQAITSHIFQNINDQGGNIITYKMAQPDSRECKHLNEKEIADTACLDVTFDSFWSNQSNIELCNRLFEWVGRDKKLLAANITTGQSRCAEAVVGK